MSCLSAGLLGNLRRPRLPLPIEAFGRRLLRHTLPPDAAIGSERDIGKDRIAREGGHRVWIGSYGSPRRNAEEAGFRINGAQLSVFVRTDPGDVVTYGPDFPAFESLGWHQHG